MAPVHGRSDLSQNGAEVCEDLGLPSLQKCVGEI